MNSGKRSIQISLRPAGFTDLQQIVNLDAKVSGMEKKEYWEDPIRSGSC